MDTAADPPAMNPYNPSHSNASSANVTAYYTMISTVADQKKLFSRHEINDVDTARQLYRLIGRPSSEADFQRILANGLFRGHSVSQCQLRSRPHTLHHGERGKGVQAIIRLYVTRGFTVCDLHVDNEFACIREDVYPVHLNVVAADSHASEVERSIRTIKERLRATVHGLPFKRVPKLLVIHMVADAVRCLNMFPAPNGTISCFMSPLSLVTGVPPPDNATMRLELGTYVQLVFRDNDPSNTIAARTLGTIALTAPTGNAHGDYHFLSLASGSRLSRHRWTALPMTDTPSHASRPCPA